MKKKLSNNFIFNTQPADFEKRRLTRPEIKKTLPQNREQMENDLYEMRKRLPLTPFPTAQKDAKERDFDPADLNFWIMEATTSKRAREEFWSEQRTTTTAENTHERICGTSRLHEWTCSNMVKINTRHCVTWREESSQSLNQFCCAHTTRFHSNRTVCLKQSQQTKLLPYSARIRMADYFRTNRTMYFTHHILMKDQRQSTSIAWTNEGQKATFLHLTTNETTRPTFSDVGANKERQTAPAICLHIILVPGTNENHLCAPPSKSNGPALRLSKKPPVSIMPAWKENGTI